VVKVGPNAVGPSKKYPRPFWGPQCYQFLQEHHTVVSYVEEVEPHQHRPYSSTTTSSYEAQLIAQTYKQFI